MDSEPFWLSIIAAALGIATITVSILLIGGVLWSPFAAFICNRIAKRRGLDADAFTGAGCGYSILFFLPWVYLVGRMNGGHFSRGAIVLVYVIVFALWFGLAVGYVSYWLTEDFHFDSYGLERHGLGKAVTVTVIWIGAAVANLAAWFFTLRALIRADRRRTISNPRDILPGGIYIYPFGFLLTWLIVFGILWVITYAYISP